MFGIFVKFTFGTAETNESEFNFVAAGDFLAVARMRIEQ